MIEVLIFILFYFLTGRLRVPEDLCNSTLDNDCPIALLLPSTKGMGVCSTALTYFLVNTHDEFLGTFRSMTNQERYYFVTKVYFPIDDSLRVVGLAALCWRQTR